MNCIKCNSPIPNGGRFCPVCGADCSEAVDVKPAAEPVESEKKYYCGKCGLELRKGAKFCAVCGAPAANVGDIRPIENSGAVFGQGDMAAVSLKKPADSDGLVSAMNSAAEASANSVPTPANTSVPTPSNDIPVPAGAVPMPSNDTGAGFSSGTGAADAGYSAPTSAPTYAPPAPTNSPDFENPFGEMGGAAAAVVTPIKKKHGGKIALIIIAALVVILGAAAVFFFTNKATALSLVMGKPKYATMVEGNLIKETTEKIDTASVADGIKSASGFYAALATVDNSYMNPYYYGTGAGRSGIIGLANTATGSEGAADMMSVSGDAVNVKGIIDLLNQSLADFYGTNNVNVTVGMNVSVDNADFRNELADSLYGSDLTVDDLLGIINGTTLSYNISASESAAAVGYAINSGSITLDVKTLITEKGEVYLALPFASDKALMFKVDTDPSAASEQAAPLELDEKEISRLLGELVDIYLGYYENSAIEMGDGELSGAGLVASGKLITAEFDADTINSFFNDIGEHIADDDYFREKITEYLKNYDAEISEEDYREGIMDIFGDTGADGKDKLVISTVIDNGGNVLAKSFKAVDDKDYVLFTYINSKEEPSFEISERRDEETSTILSVTNAKESEKDGKATVKFAVDESTVVVTVDYSGVEKAEFCGKDTYVGTYTFGLTLSEDMAYSNEDKEMIDAVNSAKLTLTSKIDSENSASSSVALSADGYGSISVNASVTAQNDDSALAVPANAIDLTAIANGSEQEIPEELKNYLKEVSEKLKSMDDGSILGKALGEASGDINDMLDPKAKSYEVMDLSNSAGAAANEIRNYSKTYNVNDSALSKRAGDLAGKYEAIASELSDKNFDITQAEFEEFKKQFETLETEKATLKSDYEKKKGGSSSGSSGSSGLTSHKNDNFDNMSEDDIIDLANEYIGRYANCVLSADNEALSSDKVIELTNKAADAAQKVLDDYDTFSKSVDGGKYDVGLLRNLRKSTKSLVDAVEALEAEMKTHA